MIRPESKIRKLLERITGAVPLIAAGVLWLPLPCTAQTYTGSLQGYYLSSVQNPSINTMYPAPVAPQTFTYNIDSNSTITVTITITPGATPPQAVIVPDPDSPQLFLDWMLTNSFSVVYSFQGSVKIGTPGTQYLNISASGLIGGCGTLGSGVTETGRGITPHSPGDVVPFNITMTCTGALSAYLPSTVQGVPQIMSPDQATLNVELDSSPGSTLTHFDGINASLDFTMTTGSAPPDLKIEQVGGAPHIEFVQSVQTATGSGTPVPLIAGKDTMMRIFPQVVGTGAQTLNIVTAVVSYNGGTPVPVGPITARSSPNRANLQDSLNYKLPPEMTVATTTGAPASFSVRLVYPPGAPDDNATNPLRTATVAAEFVTSPWSAPVIAWLPICVAYFTGDKSGHVACPSEAVGDFDALTNKLFPLNNIIYLQLKTAKLPLLVPTSMNPWDPEDLALGLRNLVGQYKKVIDLKKPGLIDQLVGWVPGILVTYASDTRLVTSVPRPNRTSWIVPDLSTGFNTLVDPTVQPN